MTNMNLTPAQEYAVAISGHRVTKNGEYDRRHNNPGRPAIFDDKWGKIEALQIIRDAGDYHPNAPKAPVSLRLTLKLVDMGFVEPIEIKCCCGRSKKVYRLTGKAKSYLSLSKGWKK